jgi:hypothetical protein
MERECVSLNAAGGRILSPQLVRQRAAVGERTFEITFRAGGVEAYVFSFG